MAGEDTTRASTCRVRSWLALEDPAVYKGVMNDAQWDEKMRAFLKKTGEDFKRFGRDVREETQRLLDEVKDQERQKKMRQGLQEVGVWAKKTAEEVADLVEVGVKKAEEALHTASERVTDFAAARRREPAPTAPSRPQPPKDAPKPTPEPASKTIGPRKKKSAPKRSTTQKTIGKKKAPSSKG